MAAPLIYAKSIETVGIELERPWQPQRQTDEYDRFSSPLHITIGSSFVNRF
jgi:hypothetical protein